MTQPVQQAPARPLFSGPWGLSRFLMFVGAVCFFLAVLVVCGVNVLDGPARAWAFGGFSAWMLAAVV